MALFDKLKKQVKSQVKDALDTVSQNLETEPALTQERVIPKTDILSVQTFTQSRGFKGYRRERVSIRHLDGVELNLMHFAEAGFDFTNSAIQLMVVKANNEIGICIRVVVDGRFIGNMYRSERNAETFDNIVAKNIDKVHIRVEPMTDDIQNYDVWLFAHWKGIAPRVTIE